ncbi:MAG: UDP-N-acetylmuramoyl-tripeptide--D-alanyl-D-alanine ligase [bacterium]|nr:UDP-N-acetylmuramoyl-tripeptide--D-alanyl-D-alanine ligase [bacterium]
MKIFLFVALCLWLRRFIYQTTTSLHIFQLEGYRNLRFLKCAIKHPISLLDTISLVAFPFLFFLSFFSEDAFCILWSLLGIFLFVRCKKKEAKKPLVWTARAKRLLGMTLLTGALLISVSFFSLILLFIISQLLLQFSALNIAIANILILPVEKLICQRYIGMAKKRLKAINPKVIGITGSYGKTSTKHILAHILSRKYKVLATPESYNTLMGICKVINNDLLPEHEIFIVEMGAYKKGDIKELCDLVRPEIGILTKIGIQHLERFGSIEKIAATKFELIDTLPEDGIAILNSNCEYCQTLQPKVKTIKYGGQEKGIKVSAEGSSFSVYDKQFQTSLLGSHNIQNISLAIPCAMELKMTLEEIKEAVFSLPQIPHRLQLIKRPNAIIIDDAYNSNPVGVKEALSVLSQFSGRKVLVTPGMIELGQKEYEENRLFGEEAAKTCNFVILVGKKRTKAIADGLLNAGFSKDNLFVVKSLDEARDRLSQIRGDVILFENDLPDNYDE